MYRLTRGAEKLPTPPTLDPAQRAVVEHAGGPLLVLAGPGTGKTTTLVECVVDRIERRGAIPDSILVLTFSRKAAADLRARIAARLGRTTVAPMAMTFHAFCYALVRRFGDGLGVEAPGFGTPLRLLTGPEQEFRVRETLQGSLETQRAQWPSSLARAFPTRAFAAEVRAVLAKARQLGMDPDDVVAAGEAVGREEWASTGAFFDEYLDVLDAEGVLDYAELVHRCRILLAEPDVVATLRTEIDWVFVDEYQDTDPSQVRLLQAVAGDGRDVVVVGDPDQSIYAFRGAEARGILDFPELFRTPDGAPAPVVALNPTRRFGRLLLASRNVATRLGVPRALPADVFAGFREPKPIPNCPRVGGGLHLHQRRRRGGAHRRDPAQRASARRSAVGRDGRAGAGRPDHDSRPDPSAGRGRGTGRGGRGRDPAGRRPRRPSAAAGAAGRGPRLCAHRGRGAGAAHLSARRDGQHGVRGGWAERCARPSGPSWPGPRCPGRRPN